MTDNLTVRVTPDVLKAQVNTLGQEGDKDRVSCLNLPSHIREFYPKEGTNIIRFLLPKEAFAEFSNNAVAPDFLHFGKRMNTHFVDGNLYVAPAGWNGVGITNDVTYNLRKGYWDAQEEQCRTMAPRKRVLCFVADYEGDKDNENPKLCIWNAPLRTLETEIKSLFDYVYTFSKDGTSDFISNTDSKRVIFTYNKADDAPGSYSSFQLFPDETNVGYKTDYLETLPFFTELINVTSEDELVRKVKASLEGDSFDFGKNVSTETERDVTNDIPTATAETEDVDTVSGAGSDFKGLQL